MKPGSSSSASSSSNSSSSTSSSSSGDMAYSPQDGDQLYAFSMIINRVDVPDEWDRIVIGGDTTLTGNFVIPNTRTKPLTIMGLDRETSIIEGIGSHKGYTRDGAEAFNSCAVHSPGKRAVITVKNLTSKNPDFYHLLSRGKLIADGVRLISGHDHAEKDGFGGGDGSEIRNSFISTFDDSIKIYSKANIIENVTIEHLRNGAPIQLGWSGQNNGSVKIKNLTVIDASEFYNMATIAWARNTASGVNTRQIEIDGFTRITAEGMNKAPLYQFGRKSGTAAVNNAIVEISGYCNKNDVRRYNNSDAVIDCK